MLAMLALGAFALLLLLAAACDIASMEIPNAISIVAAGLYPIVAFALGAAPEAIGAHLLFGAALFVAGFFAFQFGLMGGGDAKVIAAVAVWTGAGAFLPFLFVMAVTGGALALVLLLARKLAKPAPARPAFLNRLLDPARGIPYAVAICAGGLFVLNQLPIAAH